MMAAHSWWERSSSVATCRRVMTQHWPTSNCHGLITVSVCSLSSMIAHRSSRPAIPSQRSHGSRAGSSINCLLRFRRPLASRNPAPHLIPNKPPSRIIERFGRVESREHAGLEPIVHDVRLLLHLEPVPRTALPRGILQPGGARTVEVFVVL